MRAPIVCLLGVVLLGGCETLRNVGVLPKPDPMEKQAERLRMVSYPKLNSINTGYTGDGSMILSNNAHTGGTCSGDSGGPNFLGSSNVIAGVTSFGKNSTCAGTGGVYRVDRADDLAFVMPFLD